MNSSQPETDDFRSARAPEFAQERQQYQMTRRDCLRYAGVLPIYANLQSYELTAETSIAPEDSLMTGPHQLTVATASLEIAYEQSGLASGLPIVLLHGFPYDVRQYDAVRSKLTTSGYRVLVPYLRGFGATRYRNQHVFRTGQQAALGKDVIDFLDALHISQAVLVGYDWGGRAACVAAALWPERILGIVSCSGYTIQEIAKDASTPASPAEVYRRWYTLYFNTEMGPPGLEQNRKEFCKLLWQLWSPTWQFSEAEYQRTALSFDNPDFVATVIHQYRHRYGNAQGDPAYQELEARLAEQPPIAVPMFILSGGKDGVEPPAPNDPRRDRLTGNYYRRILPEVGHCVPAEAPHEIVAAIAALLKWA